MKDFIDKFWLAVVKKYYSWPTFRPFIKIGVRKSKHDNRSFEWYRDRRQYGVDATSTWGLSGDTIAWFTPRLKMYKLCTPFFPNHLDNMEQWHALLDDMIFFLEYEKDYSSRGRLDEAKILALEEAESRARRGQLLLFKHFWEFGW